MPAGVPRRETHPPARGPADEPGRIRRFLDLLAVETEAAIRGEALEKIVSCPAFLERTGSRERMTADHFMRGLAIAPGGDGSHEKFLGGHERQLGVDSLADSSPVHLEPAGNVLH